MLYFTEAYQEIETYLNAQKFEGKPSELYEPISYSINLGGKRLRPAILLIAAEIFGANKEEAKNAAVAIELFHNFTLVHDDIMDDAPLRRGKATVFKKWNRDIAILSGDVMFVKAIDYFLEISDAKKLKKILQLFNKTAAEVCEGQQYDMNFESIKNVSIQEYLHMIELKTAVLLACALQIGAILGDASEKDAQLMYDFGKNIGIAFQLQDDYLDAFANPDTFGKRVGGDIIANKKTYLLLEALNLANAEQKKELDFCLSQDIADDEKVQRIKAVYNQLKIAERSQEKMKIYFDLGISALAEVNINSDLKKPLITLAEELMKRDI